MTQPSFDQKLASVRELLETMGLDNGEEADPALLHAGVAELCEIAKSLPPADRAHAASVMETLLSEIDTLIARTQDIQSVITKKLNHVRPHKQAVAAFLKASQTD
jgi:hypothetical protein